MRVVGSCPLVLCECQIGRIISVEKYSVPLGTQQKNRLNFYIKSAQKDGNLSRFMYLYEPICRL